MIASAQAPTRAPSPALALATDPTTTPAQGVVSTTTSANAQTAVPIPAQATAHAKSTRQATIRALAAAASPAQASAGAPTATTTTTPTPTPSLAPTQGSPVTTIVATPHALTPAPSPQPPRALSSETASSPIAGITLAPNPALASTLAPCTITTTTPTLATATTTALAPSLAPVTNAVQVPVQAPTTTPTTTPGPTRALAPPTMPAASFAPTPSPSAAIAPSLAPATTIATTVSAAPAPALVAISASTRATTLALATPQATTTMLAPPITPIAVSSDRVRGLQDVESELGTRADSTGKGTQNGMEEASPVAALRVADQVARGVLKVGDKVRVLWAPPLGPNKYGPTAMYFSKEERTRKFSWIFGSGRPGGDFVEGVPVGLSTIPWTCSGECKLDMVLVRGLFFVSALRQMEGQLGQANSSREWDTTIRPVKEYFNNPEDLMAFEMNVPSERLLKLDRPDTDPLLAQLNLVALVEYRQGFSTDLLARHWQGNLPEPLSCHVALTFLRRICINRFLEPEAPDACTKPAPKGQAKRTAQAKDMRRDVRGTGGAFDGVGHCLVVIAQATSSEGGLEWEVEILEAGAATSSVIGRVCKLLASIVRRAVPGANVKVQRWSQPGFRRQVPTPLNPTKKVRRAADGQPRCGFTARKILGALARDRLLNLNEVTQERYDVFTVEECYALLESLHKWMEGLLLQRAQRSEHFYKVMATLSADLSAADAEARIVQPCPDIDIVRMLAVCLGGRGSAKPHFLFTSPSHKEGSFDSFVKWWQGTRAYTNKKTFVQGMASNEVRQQGWLVWFPVGSPISPQGPHHAKENGHGGSRIGAGRPQKLAYKQKQIFSKPRKGHGGSNMVSSN